MGIDTVCLILTGVLIVLDIVSGFTVGIIKKSIDSTKMRQGLLHKALYVIVIIIAYALEWAGSYIDDITIPVLIPALLYICCIEISSIMENIVQVAPELKENPVFSVLNRANDRKDDDDDDERN